MNNNFFISTDSDGNMPALTYNKPVKNWWVQYVDNSPSRVKPYPEQDRLWNYKLSRMEALRPGVQCYSGKGELPVTEAKVVE